MPILRSGKVPPETLEKHVFPYLGSGDSDIIHGPGIGRDAALIRIGRQVAVVTTDPITGAVHKIGSYVIHICANDVATFGIRPRWFLATILLPENANTQLLEDIMVSMHTTAKKLNVAIIGGHTEVTPGLGRPIIIGFMLGIAEDEVYVTSSNAQPDNSLILTKGVAIEGTAILAAERANDLRQKLAENVIEQAQLFINQLSVVPEAMEAMKTGAVTAMHDPTEGGVANGIHEMANASGVGFIVDRGALMIHEETRHICQALEINPLNLIASGAMLIAADRTKANSVIKALQKAGISAASIGRLVADPKIRNIIELDGSIHSLPQPKEDALWNALTKSVKQ
ncbi:MAG: AIR synthase family protein [Promethearchaeota archaeon]